MTSRGAGGDLAETVGNLCPWRHRGRRYRSAVVPALNECLLILCARYRLHSREAGCAPADQQLNRHDDRWNLVLAERLRPRGLAMLRIGATSLSQRSECRSGPTALPPRQVTPRACTSTSTAWGRASAPAPIPDSHDMLSGRQGALVVPSRNTASRATSLQSRPYAVSTQEFGPEGHRSVLHFHGVVNGYTGGDISLGVIEPLSASRVSEESMPETRSAR